MYEDLSLKIIIVGTGGVGKSSLIKRYSSNEFSEYYKKTIGVDFTEKEIEITYDSVLYKVKFMLWDMAGQEDFLTITKSYFRGAHAAILMFSSTDRGSFDAVKSWKETIDKECQNGIPMVLLQNKSDLISQSKIDRNEAGSLLSFIFSVIESLARQLKLKLYRVSVKDGLNIDDSFKYIAELYIKRNPSSVNDDLIRLSLSNEISEKKASISLKSETTHKKGISCSIM